MNNDEQDTATLKALLQPYLPPGLEWHSVSPQVNCARIEDLIVPTDDEMVSARSN